MLTLEGVSAGYRGVCKLRRVSAVFAPGRFYALVGPNGSGKTTLLKAAAGLLPLMEGSVRADEMVLNRRAPKAWARRVAYLPQRQGLPNITVRTLVSYGRYPYGAFGRSLTGEDVRAVERALNACGLREEAGRAVCELSGGERQRAYIAMLLAQDAPVMLLDEPTAHLDPRHQFDLMRILREEARAGRTAIAVLHDLTMALTCADEVLVLEEGSLVARGEPDALLDGGVLGRVFGVAVRRLGEGEYSLRAAE